MPLGSTLGGAASGAAAGSVAGPVGAVAGALIGAAGSYFSGKQSADYAEFSQKHKYRWMVNDLKKAGLNPMLAVSQSPGSPPQPTFENMGEGAVKGFSAVQQAQLMKAQIDNQRASEQKTLAESEAQGMTNVITKSSPEYLASLKTLGKFGEVTGPSAIAQSRIDSELATKIAQTTTAQTQADTARLQNEIAKGDLSLQQTRIKYADELGRIEVALKGAEALSKQLGIPLAAAEAKLWEELGVPGRIALLFKTLLGK